MLSDSRNWHGKGDVTWNSNYSVIAAILKKSVNYFSMKKTIYIYLESSWQT
jgi:hypothetical protein